MWIGGYSDWTPAEQREWDRDLEEIEDRKKQQELNAIKAESKTWKEWALYNPLYEAYLIGQDNPLTLTVYLCKNSPVRSDVERNRLFEMTYPIYLEVNKALQRRFPKGTSQIKLQVSSWEYEDVEYIRYFTPQSWSYTVMEDIVKGLYEQLIPPRDLCPGIVIKPSSIKK